MAEALALKFLRSLSIKSSSFAVPMPTFGTYGADPLSFIPFPCCWWESAQPTGHSWYYYDWDRQSNFRFKKRELNRGSTSKSTLQIIAWQKPWS